jgi:hypothetical protein
LPTPKPTAAASLKKIKKNLIRDKKGEGLGENKKKIPKHTATASRPKT